MNGIAQAATLKPANCGVNADGGNTAYGNTPAHVKLVIWQACDGGYYASAYSYPDSTGWTFTGRVRYGAYDSSNVMHWSAWVSCGKGACDSPEIYDGAPGKLWQGQYQPNNGQFNRNTCTWTAWCTSAEVDDNY
jgi:hypothetical protein